MVVHYGRPEDTERCLDRLDESTVPASVIVIDNAGAFPGRDATNVIRPAQNLGFAGGANVGASAALGHGATHVWFVNNDAEPPPDTLARLLATARGCGPASLVGSLEVDPRDIDALGPWVNRAPVLPRALRCRVRSVNGPLGPVDFLSGFSLLVSAPVFEACGYFDEAFFHYFEDVDFTIRAVRAGADALLDCSAPVWHQRASVLGTGTEADAYYFFRNRLLLAARCRGIPPAIALLVADPRHGLLPLISRRRIRAGDWSWLRGAWRGTIAGLLGRTGPAEAR